MHRPLKRTLTAILIVVCLHLVAGRLQGKDNKQHSNAAKHLFVPNAFLGNSQIRSGGVKVDQMATLLQQGLTSQDSSGNKFKVIAFNFTFADPEPYEDSAGNMQLLTDYSSQYITGNMLDSVTSKFVLDHLRPADTFYFDRISVVRYIKNTDRTYPDSTAFEARPFKCYVTH
jgi:hypothetical protein